MKKQLIFLLLIGIAAIIATGTVSAATGDKYVNGTGGSDTYDGNSWEYAYQTIQKGLDNVAEGGTVNIAEGTYTGTGNTNLDVKTSEVTIKGSGQDQTIIDGQDTKQILHVDSGEKVTVQDLSMQNGNSNYGGAISNTGNLTVTDSNFKSNKAIRGGAIYNNGGTLNVTGSTFTSNNVTQNGGAIANTGNLEITDSAFSGNKAIYYGGAIYNYGSSSSVTVNGSELTDNTANQGGAIYGDGISKITGSTFTSNTATTNGGSIYNTGNTEVTNSKFTTNKASSNGGAIYSAVGSAKITSSELTDNTATSWGGAIYNSGNAEVTSSTITGNKASFGGAIFNYEPGTLTIAGNEFTGNIATSGGGAILNRGTLTANSNIFTGNNATNYGGAIYNYGTPTILATLNITDSEFTNNIANYGGGIYNLKTAEFARSTFNGNKATYNGGAIANDATGSILTVTESIFTGNTATNTNSYGGAISNKGTAEVASSTFKSNIAAIEGGAISNYGTSSILTVTDSTFESNTITTYGGAIANDGTLNVSRSAFKVNTANNGGAIASSGIVNVTGSTFTDNKANNNGGAIAIIPGTLTVTGSTFTGNTATSYGGAIHSTGIVEVANSVFASNKANWGGAIFSSEPNGNLTITGSDFTVNAATSGGGAILNRDILTAHFNRFFGNTAPIGSAIYGYMGSADATNNWWGSNTNPTTIPNLINVGSSGSVDADPWLVLSINADPTSMNLSKTGKITVDLFTNSNGENKQADAESYPAEIPLTFTTNLGTFKNNGQTLNTVLRSGVATVDFIAGSYPGTANINAQVDNEIKTVTVTVNPVLSTMDIQPGDYPNAINLNSKGVIPVAILSTSTYDANSVNPSSVTFGHTGTEQSLVKYVWKDANSDGITDLILYFDPKKTGLLKTDTEALLKGFTTTGLAIEGRDSIKIVPK